MTLALVSLLAGFALVALAEDPEPPDPPVRPAVKEPALRDELLRRMKADQDARVELMRLIPSDRPVTPEDRQRPEVKAAIEQMERADKANRAWLKGVVEQRGWPGKSLVGPDGAQGAFLIAQHAVGDLDFMAKCLGLLKEAYHAGEAEGQWVALMTDRLLVLKEKKRQLYGTQLMLQDGKLVPQPIEDEANVDRRRKDLGLPPLADYLKMANGRPGPPVKPPGANSTPPKQD